MLGVRSRRKQLRLWRDMAGPTASNECGLQSDSHTALWGRRRANHRVQGVCTRAKSSRKPLLFRAAQTVVREGEKRQDEPVFQGYSAREHVRASVRTQRSHLATVDSPLQREARWALTFVPTWRKRISLCRTLDDLWDRMIPLCFRGILGVCGMTIVPQ
jgi:hypothetical protein